MGPCFSGPKPVQDFIPVSMAIRKPWKLHQGTDWEPAVLEGRDGVSCISEAPGKVLLMAHPLWEKEMCSFDSTTGSQARLSVCIPSGLLKDSH